MAAPACVRLLGLQESTMISSIRVYSERVFNANSAEWCRFIQKTCRSGGTGADREEEEEYELQLSWNITPQHSSPPPINRLQPREQN